MNDTLAARPKILTDLLTPANVVEAAPFLLCSDRVWTYGEFAHEVDRFATGLAARGIKKNDRIAIAAPNSVEWLITWFATARLGAILVTLNVAYRHREFDYMLNQSAAVMLICCAKDGDFDFVEFLDQLRPQFGTVKDYVILGGEGFAGSTPWDAIPTEPDRQHLRELEGHVQPEDPAVILYTSGTTGEPKGAVLTHASILASAVAQAEHLDQTSQDVAIGHMPLNHVGGMTCTVSASMVAGGRVALLSRYSPKQALEAIDRHGVSIYIGVPTMYTMMMDLSEFAAADISTIRTCIIGGSNVEPAMGRRILDTFVGSRMANLYGLSESSGGCIISAAGDDLDTLVATLGVPIGDFEVRIAGDDYEPVPHGTEGELLVRGGCITRGYWASPQQSAASFLDDGWLVTGDVATQREDGRVALCGRKKEMYVRSGYNVYPVEIENVLAREDSVAMTAVIGVPDDLLGEVGHAFVVPSPGCSIDVEALFELCRTQLARYKIPAEIHVVESLPLTPSGKIKKVTLKDSYVSPSNQ